MPRAPSDYHLSTTVVLALRQVGGLTDLDNIAVGIADVAARLGTWESAA
jgi:hypothetical protein